MSLDTTFPRMGLPELTYFDVDSTSFLAQLKAEYEEIIGEEVTEADPRYLHLAGLAQACVHVLTNFNSLARQNYLSYAVGNYLDSLGAYLGCERQAAEGATCTLRFTLTQELINAYIIPKGTEATTADNIIFATDEALEIPIGELTGEVSATCAETGETGNNIDIGLVNTLVETMAYIESVENIDVSQGGTETEDDEDYAERIALAPSSFSVAGPQKAYEYHVLSYSGSIIDASVYYIADTPGWVYIHFLLENGELPGQTMVDGLHDYLSAEDMRPLTDHLFISAPAAVEYRIEFTWYLSEDDLDQQQQIEDAVTEAVEEYRLWQQAEIGRDINPDRLIELVRIAGGKRLEVASPSFTQLEAYEIAQCPADNVAVTFGGSEDK